MPETLLATPVGCTIRRLPDELIIPAARHAVLCDPRNEPAIAQFATLVNHPAQDSVMRPEFIAALTTKYWGPQTRKMPVWFADNPDQATRKLILQFANEWRCGITFYETLNQSEAVCRIGRGPYGHYSYLGTDNQMIDINQITMNLQGFVATTPISEYWRVVCHEFGHFLGCPHEHARAEIIRRLNQEATIRRFMAEQGWSRAQVIAQVFTPIEQASIMGTPSDETSIMTYRFEGDLTLDGNPIVGGTKPNASDLGFMLKIYPKIGTDDPSLPPIQPPTEPPPVELPKGTRLRQGRWSATSKYEPKKGPTPFLINVAEVGAYSIDIAGEGNWEVKLSRVGNAEAVPLRAPGKPPKAPNALVSLWEKGDYLLTVRHRNANRPGAFRVRYM
jgi:hypothetical protein